ncbi:MAG: epoxide hydrolase family protein [Pseudomonadota bacterium]
MGGLRAFEIHVEDETLERLRTAFEAYRWPPAPPDAGWAMGMDQSALETLHGHFLSDYDWRHAEAGLNAYPHFLAEVDGLDIHFVHVVGEAEGKRPLLLTHGWPGSFFEFWDAAPKLAWPTRYGAPASDAFDLIIPSLPGYGWSGKPASPLGQKDTARLFDVLMREVLGYPAYLAQGGDWGGVVTSYLGLNHGAGGGRGGARAIHLNMIGLRPTPATPETEAEKAWLAQTRTAMQLGGSYFMQQATKPQTLAYGLHDSPVGQLAWICEKFHGWSDLGSGGLFDVYTPDQLLTNAMIYLVNDAFTTSIWYYAAFANDGGPALPEGLRCETPTAFADFPGEGLFGPPPRSWAERAYNITRWTKMPRGGHFAAMEEPDLFVDELREWAREVG